MRLLFNICGAALGVLVWTLPAAAWDTSELPALKSAFISRIATKYVATEAGWAFSSDCQAADCYGTNPDSPYGLPVFTVGRDQTRTSKARQLKPTDALVVIMETPPPARYFGVTPYLYKRYYSGGPPNNPGGEPVVPVFESLTDTVNMDILGTTGSSTPGVNPFSQLAAFIVTADTTTCSDAFEQLVALGFPLAAINLLPLPINAVPLKMGVSAEADTFSIVTRTAYPDDPAALDDYISRAPVATLHITPRTSRNVVPVQAPVAREPGTGSAEPASVASARDLKVAELRNKYLPNYTVRESLFVPKQSEHYVCIDWGLECNGDNTDAIYTSDLRDYIPTSRKDKILIVGVNHVRLNKATYLSHSVVDASNKAGVVAVGDSWIEVHQTSGSNVYAFTIAYDCEGDANCLTIPEPTTHDPSGLPFGSPLHITGRTYLEPGTGTRPDIDELILHRVFVLTKR